MRIVNPSITLINITSDSAKVIERAGRTCYKSESNITDNSADEFVEMICMKGHISVIEHASASFRIVCDRGITHEIVRHRLASYSQESTRYCNYSKKKFGREISVIQPSQICSNSKAFDIWKKSCENAEQAYFALIDNDVKPQNARSVLPTCLKTEIVMTTNLREWSWFLEKRLPVFAHPDMRLIARAIWASLVKECPAVFLRFTKLANKS